MAFQPAVQIGVVGAASDPRQELAGSQCLRTGEFLGHHIRVHECRMWVAGRQVAPDVPELLEIGSCRFFGDLRPERRVTTGPTSTRYLVPQLGGSRQREELLGQPVRVVNQVLRRTTLTQGCSVCTRQARMVLSGAHLVETVALDRGEPILPETLPKLLRQQSVAVTTNKPMRSRPVQLAQRGAASGILTLANAYGSVLCSPIDIGGKRVRVVSAGIGCGVCGCGVATCSSCSEVSLPCEIQTAIQISDLRILKARAAAHTVPLSQKGF